MGGDSILKRADWLQSGDIRPYVFVRPENQIQTPGARHRLDWFPHQPILKNPMDLKELAFADRIYSIEERAFGPSNMAMPRWVFYDCAVIPGFVAGFAARPSVLSPAVRELMSPRTHLATGSPAHGSRVLTEIMDIDAMDWVPLSLFIIIPTMHKGEWVAHNLCSVNSILPKQEHYFGLGFLSKAFGLWYANVQQCSGMTQWGGPALRLHAHFGPLEIIGAYAPVHSHAKTITYRCEVNTSNWEQFFTKESDMAFLEKYGPSGFSVDPLSEDSMVALQRKIENGEGPFYLNASEVTSKDLHEKLTVFQLKKEF